MVCVRLCLWSLNEQREKCWGNRLRGKRVLPGALLINIKSYCLDAEKRMITELIFLGQIFAVFILRKVCKQRVRGKNTFSFRVTVSARAKNERHGNHHDRKKALSKLRDWIRIYCHVNTLKGISPWERATVGELVVLCSVKLGFHSE